MKILALMILAITYTIVSYGQQMNIKDSVIMSLPKGAKKIEKPYQNIKDSKFEIFSRDILKDLDIYRIGGYPVLIHPGDAKVSPGYLKELQFNLDESAASAKPNYHNSIIKSYKNFDAFIMNTEYKNAATSTIWFFCVNKTNERCFNGRLEYPIGDRASAEKVMEDLLNSTNFK